MLCPPSASITANIDRDPARVVTGVPLPQPGQGVAERLRQTGGVGEVGQEPGSGVGDHAGAVGGDGEFRSGPGNLHPEIAFRTDVMRPSTNLIVPVQKALTRFWPTQWITDPETPGPGNWRRSYFVTNV
ncbi:hypothetical protein Drose_18290 [Dactylosporangium roseum]|uniref:Uncharacterized protein n=1 Tax=Dactylosporangium roseum TaxID=47989 RepID=A0ABY5ZE72_9ACTN|nr:hypothetical protein Drose_18290 [Dactylosporangium roseum]